MKPALPLVLLASVVGLALVRLPAATATVVFSTNFETGMPAEFSAPGAVIEGVQGYSGLGPVGRRFGGNFLHYTAVTIFPTKLTVRNLPPHDHLSVKHLLAIIDSWDSTELMQISVDGVLRFDHRFSLALADTTTYFPAPAGAILSMGHDLGFSGCCYYNRDRAYDLGVEPAFLDIPHTADSVQVVWSISAVSGPAATQWQGGGDESWGVDAVSIEVSTSNVGVGDPAAPVERLFFAAPNPAHGGAAAVTFTLRSAEPATLELLDLAGRRIDGRAVGALGAGVHRVTFGSERRIAPGIYLARLTEGRAVRTTRVAILE